MLIKSTPIISVVIPSYNKARYLPSTVQTVLSQTLKDWELIIVDDNSTDGSVELIKEFALTDTRIKFVVSEENKGANYCRNVGIKMARGAFLMFLDADDLLTHFCLFQRFSEMQKNDQYDFIVFPTGTFYKEIGDSDRDWKTPEHVNHLHLFLQHRLPWNISSPFWKTAFVLKEGGFDENMNWLQDVEFHTRMLLVKGVRYKVVNNIPPDFFYRIDQNRLIKGHFFYTKNYVQGQLQYIKKMLDVISNSDPLFRMDPRYLKGSLASALRMVFYSASLSKISSDEQAELYDVIMSDESVLKLLGRKDRLLIRIYRLVYAVKMQGIKGTDTIFKYLLTR
ncbi:MAG: glycosyltransferase family 2 protein [Chitinophagaceae bacterium]|nr:glycosyltransferase family 2 protein [Chitinophagaceae bacterium]